MLVAVLWFLLGDRALCEIVFVPPCAFMWGSQASCSWKVANPSIVAIPFAQLYLFLLYAMAVEKLVTARARNARAQVDEYNYAPSFLLLVVGRAAI